MMIKLCTTFLMLLASAVAETDGLRNFERDLQTVDTIVIGRNDQSVTVTVDQEAVSGAIIYGVQYISLSPAVSGGSTELTCTATLASGLIGTANMAIYLRKALRPDTDENGENKDYDCAGDSDNDYIGNDVESCKVTNFPTLGDVVLGAVVMQDTGNNLGSTYTINVVCDTFTPSGDIGGAFCFSEDSTVDVLGKGTTPMKDLAVGDKIMAQDGSYEPVYAFAHLEKTQNADFFQFYTQNKQQKPVELTGDHLIMANGKYVPAKEVQVGDLLQGGNGIANAVTQINMVSKEGLYAPLTPSGTILSNGVATSSYVTLANNGQSGSNVVLGEGSIDTGLSWHFVHHFALSPIRMACMGISPSFCSTDHINEENGGYAPFVNFWFALVNILKQQSSVFVQMLFFAGFLVVIGPLYALECIFGAAMVPSLVAGGVALVSLAAKQQVARIDVGNSKVKSV